MSASKSITAALIIIGDEILSGQTQDVNLSALGRRLADKGVVMVESRMVRDREDEIVIAVNELRQKYDYVFTTGGIGPTHDDITAASIAKAFGVFLVEHEEARKRLEAHYAESEQTVNAARLKMAQIPEGATLIDNPVSAAPGFKLENVYVMAGVPRIMQAMLDSILDVLESTTPILSNTISCQLLEGDVAEDIGALQQDYPQISIGSYPHFRGGVLGLSLVLRGTDRQALEVATQKSIDIIRKLGGTPRALSLDAGELLENVG